MQQTFPIAVVAECTVPECVYNRGSRCFARAITVGDGAEPECVTFHSSNSHVPRQPAPAAVGACRIYSCRHNRDFNCEAARVHLGYRDSAIGCLTYART